MSGKKTETSEKPETQIKNEKKKWNYSIYLIAAAMFFYILSELTFSTWIVSYLNIKRGFSISEASMGLTVFWLFITFGRFAADKIGKYMKIYQFILGSSILALVGYCFVFFATTTTLTFVLIAIMGCGFAALYASILSYGMDQLPYNSPKLMSLLVLAGTIGVILALPISSFFVHSFGFLTALLVGLIFLVLLIVAIFLTMKDRDNSALTQVKQRNWGSITKRTKILAKKMSWFSMNKNSEEK